MVNDDEIGQWVMGLDYLSNGRQVLVQTNRATLDYYIGRRKARLSVELLVGSGIAIYGKDLKSWEPPFANESISNDDRDQIIKAVTEAFKSQGWFVEVVEA